MTQAFNLSQFANNLNSSGATSNAGLQNSSVTVTAGTGMSGGGAVALGSSVTLTNAGVTSVAAGTGISVSAATGGVTISASSNYQGERSTLVTTTSAFTIPTGITALKVTLVGGGGGCYGGFDSGTTVAGGSGAATTIKWLTGLTPGATLSCTIGGGGVGSANGGTTTVASGSQTITSITAVGGAGAANVFNAPQPLTVGSTGTFNIGGSQGQDGYRGQNEGLGGSNGGASWLAAPSPGYTTYGGGRTGNFPGAGAPGVSGGSEGDGPVYANNTGGAGCVLFEY